MTLQIELTPELEAKLREEAAAAGKDVATLAREAIEQSLGATDADAQHAGLSHEQWLAEWRAWTADARPLGYVVDDSLESIYERARRVSTLLDTNILTRTSQEDHPQFAAASESVELREVTMRRRTPGR